MVGKSSLLGVLTVVGSTPVSPSQVRGQLGSGVEGVRVALLL